MIALSPVVSWALFLGCVAVGVTVYLAASAWVDRREWERSPSVTEDDLAALRRFVDDAFPGVVSRIEYHEGPLVVRERPALYDWQERGDFR